MKKNQPGCPCCPGDKPPDKNMSCVVVRDLCKPPATVAGVDVQAKLNGKVVQTVTSGPNGVACFPNLKPGDYEFLAPNPPGDFSPFAIHVGAPFDGLKTLPLPTHYYKVIGCQSEVSPIPGVEVMVQQNGNLIGRFTTDDSGVVLVKFPEVVTVNSTTILLSKPPRFKDTSYVGITPSTCPPQGGLKINVADGYNCSTCLICNAYTPTKDRLFLTDTSWGAGSFLFEFNGNTYRGTQIVNYPGDGIGVCIPNPNLTINYELSDNLGFGPVGGCWIVISADNGQPGIDCFRGLTVPMQHSTCNPAFFFGGSFVPNPAAPPGTPANPLSNLYPGGTTLIGTE